MALFYEKTTLEKRVDYKTALFPRLKGRFDWRDEKSCVRALYAKIVGYAGVQWISAGLLKKLTLKKRAVSQTALFYEKTTLEKRVDFQSALLRELSYLQTPWYFFYSRYFSRGPGWYVRTCIRPQGRQERVLGWLCPVRLACLLSQVSSYNLRLLFSTYY
jgi:hypothetical protein